MRAGNCGQSSTLSVSQSSRPTQTPAEAVADILELQKRNTLGGLKIKDLVQEENQWTAEETPGT
jgi:hypothetical protein